MAEKKEELNLQNILDDISSDSGQESSSNEDASNSDKQSSSNQNSCESNSDGDSAGLSVTTPAKVESQNSEEKTNSLNGDSKLEEFKVGQPILTKDMKVANPFSSFTVTSASEPMT
jgi:hypothetical protein